MNHFGLFMGVLMVAFIVGIVLLGWFHPRSGAQTLDWKPTRSPEQEAENEVDDLAQMLAATNDKRRRRGAAELTLEGVEGQVARDLHSQGELHDEYLAAQDVAQMLAVKNQRRAQRGLPPVTEAEYRAGLGLGTGTTEEPPAQAGEPGTGTPPGSSR